MIYDVIGDVHGHATELAELLKKLGYRRRGELFEPEGEDRRALFLGDFLDRGPEIRETVRIVRAMIDAGVALTVIGNHEYNAVAFHTSDGEGRWLRSRSNPHLFQHIETLYQYRGRPREFEELLHWCRTLPFFLELPELRIAHAAWIPKDLEFLNASEPKGRALLSEQFLRRSAREGTPENDAVEHILKGIEIELPEGVYFVDKEGFRRGRSRVAWWMDPSEGEELTVGDVVFPRSVTESSRAIAPEERALLSGYDHEKPLFLGHYWLSGEPKPLTPRIACLDYSVAAGGKLVAYTFRGEEELLEEHFVSVPRRP
jgi:hypothetical protein